ncbi:vesicle-associated protein 2-2-like isoform X1 [Zea mays]|uniref:vesicle-associated protein 2-2-like isoform X1 n=1 Tax=Zea mays TaxID=4577 RepID=UPI0009AAD35A|nr:uncharacterized protein LOC100382633 isoform X1 [Zea mays]|eukprot:XP_023156558.1 uncharacterized protein LOC100382633 isoform X1 [Zea mays]
MGHECSREEKKRHNEKVEVKKQSSCVVHLINKSNDYVAFKVKTTSPKRYCVRPNTGVILPRKTCEFTVTMQALRTAPPDMQLKDKFLVQTTIVPYGTSDEELVPAFFSKETGRYIEESKLRVVLVSAYQSLEEQPTNKIHDTEPVVEVPVLKEVPNIENEVPDAAKEVPAPLVQAPAIVTGIPSPVEETPGLREFRVPLNEAPAVLAESPSAQKDPSVITVEHASTVIIEHSPAISIESPPLKQSVTVFKESPPSKQSIAAFKEYPPPSKQSIAVFKESPPLEETSPKEAVVLSDRGLFSVQNHQLSHVTEDVQNLKSKLNNLESKLEEAGKMIIRLKEESRSTTQERDKLQQEMVFLRKKGTPRSQVGFPLLFVVYVALLGTLLGYLLRL